MAYHIDPDNGDIVLDGFDKGIAPDPYSGLGTINQCSIAVPGEISVGYPITNNTTSGVTLDTPCARSTRFFTSYGVGYGGGPSFLPKSFAMLDASGHVFESGSPTITGTWTYLASNSVLTGASPVDGLAYFLGYLFKFRNDSIDYWTGSAWVNGWNPATGGSGVASITGSTKHFAYVASNNVLYFTNGNYLGSITAPTPASFDPSSTATYIFSASKLQLPVTDLAWSIAEVGGGNTPQSTLLIGGTQNAIYPWDKVSSSFNLPIYIAESFIELMVSVNQNAFIFPGNKNGGQGRGRIYITNGSQANLYFKIPDFITGEQEPYFSWGDAIYHRNNLLFGFLPVKNSDGVTATASANFQVWAIDLDTKVFRPVTSLPPASAKATCLISTGALSSLGFGYIVGYQDIQNTLNKIAYSGTTAGIGGATFNTDLVPVGTLLNPKTTAQIEFKLRGPLQSGESIVIQALNNAGGATPLGTINGGAVGDISGYYTTTVEKSQWLSLNVAIVGNSASGGGRLREIRIR